VTPEAPKQSRAEAAGSTSASEEHAEWLLTVVAEQPDLTLDEMGPPASQKPEGRRLPNETILLIAPALPDWVLRRRVVNKLSNHQQLGRAGHRIAFPVSTN
jgi:hypothetical protein